MASSSTSSSDSTSFPFSPSNLPVTPMRSKIVEKITENRVTLIVGDAGCGKSSQVPQFLLEENLKPILCTQPRRFAVVAVAKTVAKARNCELGEEVGYHIGHSKNSSARSNIVFKTAGVLLEEMRDKGLNALNYKVIILDEVHERSIESDLVLVCVKQFLMKNNDLRVVLMSATADIARYRDYFKDLGRGERVEVLAIPSTNMRTIFERKVFYLEQITEILGLSSQSLSLKYFSAPNIKPEVHELIYDLVLHIHENETDIEKSILVFLPTYYSLEQQWHLLQPLSSYFKVHILHSSVDTEEALMAMRICKSHRKVILATNIAESSVTIPKVAFVIDTCRSLQVFWDNNRKKESAELVWVSKSQAEQRRGRTGRTCDGQIYRLVTRSFYSSLEDYECPSVLKLSLRQQVLQSCCAESKAINDPKVLFQRALDPPDPEIVQDALDLLVRMQALERTSRGRYEPTFYGRLLASFPLSFDASVLILKFGNIGMMHEGILIGVLMDTQPLPILRPFGDDQLWSEYTGHYFSGDNNDTGLNGRKEISYMANLCAFQFWQRVFKDKHRVERLKQLLMFDEMKATKSLLPKIEEEWCSFHKLVQSSLNRVSEIYEDILNSIHRFRPTFLGTSDGLPSYYDPYEFEHTCILNCQQNGDTDALTEDDAQLDLSHEAKKCLAIPFVTANNFQNNAVAKNFASIVKEIKAECTEVVAGNQHIGYDSLVNHEAPLCVYFLNGSCNRGSECVFSHSLQSKRPTCKYFLSLQGCRNGQSCVFSHDGGAHRSASSFNPTLCLQEEGNAKTASLLQLFPTSSYERILLLDDIDLHFTSNFARHFDPAKIICTTCLSETSIFDSSLEDVTILWGLYNPYQAIISKLGANRIPWRCIKCVLWFPNFESYGENLDRQRILLQSFFEYMAIRILADALNVVQVILTMNNLRFSQLEVEKLGRDSFFFLKKSFPFDERSFGQLPDKVPNKKPMVVSRPFSYVFNLHRPSEIQFGDYAAVLRKHMGNMQGIGVDNLTADMAVCRI
ncbi:DExH-box ATP-dependent RNA helicase DExH8 [Ziziphus jujuba]|uniref:RNA helicase n=1 Tax=Ziziphus jujuba TaxID=326968 RepID=A0A6P4AB24_ZIZJJ|nr:DExH-box ATP-dependent RNA helicase DExH8 [Ziziphus jujuba]